MMAAFRSKWSVALSSLIPQVAELALQRTKLLKWLLGRVKLREFDSNKQYASELLAILLQGSAANQQALVDADGIELLLQVWAAHLSIHPLSWFQLRCCKVYCSESPEHHLPVSMSPLR